MSAFAKNAFNALLTNRRRFGSRSSSAVGRPRRTAGRHRARELATLPPTCRHRRGRLRKLCLHLPCWAGATRRALPRPVAPAGAVRRRGAAACRGGRGVAGALAGQQFDAAHSVATALGVCRGRGRHRAGGEGVVAWCPALTRRQWREAGPRGRRSIGSAAPLDAYHTVAGGASRHFEFRCGRLTAAHRLLAMVSNSWDVLCSNAPLPGAARPGRNNC